jgi:hypothetical protein
MWSNIYGSHLDRHDPIKIQRGLESDWTTVFIFGASTARSKSFLVFSGLNLFDTKNDRLEPGWSGLARPDSQH